MSAITWTRPVGRGLGGGRGRVRRGRRRRVAAGRRRRAGAGRTARRRRRRGGGRRRRGRRRVAGPRRVRRARRVRRRRAGARPRMVTARAADQAAERGPRGMLVPDHGVQRLAGQHLEHGDCAHRDHEHPQRRGGGDHPPAPGPGPAGPGPAVTCVRGRAGRAGLVRPGQDQPARAGGRLGRRRPGRPERRGRCCGPCRKGRAGPGRRWSGLCWSGPCWSGPGWSQANVWVRAEARSPSGYRAGMIWVSVPSGDT